MVVSLSRHRARFCHSLVGALRLIFAARAGNKRYFHLKGAYLTYYSDDKTFKTKGKPSGSLSLEEASLIVYPKDIHGAFLQAHAGLCSLLSAGASGYSWGVVPKLVPRLYVLLAATESERESWISAFEEAGATLGKVTWVGVALIVSLQTRLLVDAARVGGQGCRVQGRLAGQGTLRRTHG